jgi:hypothetical protein
VPKTPSILQVPSRGHGWGIASSGARGASGGGAGQGNATVARGATRHSLINKGSLTVAWVASCNFPVSRNSVCGSSLAVAVERRLGIRTSRRGSVVMFGTRVLLLHRADVLKSGIIAMEAAEAGASR